MRKSKTQGIELEPPKPRYIPDPHRRGRVIPDKTKYTRKVKPEETE